MIKKYYMAYEDRYKQIHQKGLLWEEQENSMVVIETIKKFNFTKQDKILDLGCGEGRDAIYLLQQGYNVLGVDCSFEAVKTCQKICKSRGIKDNFRVVDFVEQNNVDKFKFIYSMCVLHMLCTEEHRKSFYDFIKNNLLEDGIALVCVMCNDNEFTSDFDNAFDCQERTHCSGQRVVVAKTSCKILNQKNLIEEAKSHNFEILECLRPQYIPGFNDSVVALIIKKGVQK